jgi:hypothetical protein
VRVWTGHVLVHCANQRVCKVLGTPAHRLRCLHKLMTRPSQSIHAMCASRDWPRPPPSMTSSASARTATGGASSPLNPAHIPSPSATPTQPLIALASSTPPHSSNVLLPSLSRSRGSSLSSLRGRASPPTPLFRALPHPDAPAGGSPPFISALWSRGNSESSTRVPLPDQQDALPPLDTLPNTPLVRWWDKRPVRGARPWVDESRRKSVPEEHWHAYVHTRQVRALMCAGRRY